MYENCDLRQLAPKEVVNRSDFSSEPNKLARRCILMIRRLIFDIYIIDLFVANSKWHEEISLSNLSRNPA